MSAHTREEGQGIDLDFSKIQRAAASGQALVPAIAQDAATGTVLVIGYANQAALEYARTHGLATFWSTSRNELWIKGATSGDYLDLVEIRVNCEQNALLYLVRPRGAGACHTKNAAGQARRGCFYRRIAADGSLEFLER